MRKYDEFLAYYKESMNYQRACTLIDWDLKTATPKEGVDGLVETLSMLSTKAFEMQTSKKMGEFLDDLLRPEEFAALSDVEKMNIKRLKKSYDKNKNVPVEFYSKYVALVAKSEDVWVEAKQNNDFASFCPYLENIVESLKQMKSYTDPGKATYDALIDDFEEGMTQDVIDGVFADIKKELIPLVKAIVAKPEPVVPQFSEYADVNKQKEWSRILLEYIGFDFKRGTISETEHPFTTNLSRKDVRITNHYYPNSILSAFYTIIHEGGHGIFEQNISGDFDDTSLTSCEFMGVHESQSRFYENILGRNINFWKPLMNKLQEDFPQFKDVTLDQFNREINHIKNSFIRVDADELTFCFHIILRYELERDLFNGKLAVKDLPKAWNQKMQEYLGITPATDSEGVLQDSHWSGAAFGYFPSYLLGSIYDGMFLDVMKQELGDVEEILAKGEITKITKWLNEKIHQYGCSRLPMDVIENVCHKPLSAEPFIRYAKEKYTKIYGLDEK